MITYAQLWTADPAAWRRAGVVWAGLTGLLDRRATELTDGAAGLRPAWSGPASRAAQHRLAGLATELVAGQPAMIEVSQVLDVLATRLTRAKALLAEAVAAADAGGVRVDRHGRASADPAVVTPDGRHGRQVAAVSAGIRAALDLAAQADREAAVRLAGLAAEAAAGWPTEPAPGPPAGADPTTVRRWWQGLSPAQRRWLIRHQPALVGRLDGVPVAARDQANRLLLGEHRAELLRRRAELVAQLIRMPMLGGAVRRIDGLLAGLDAVTERLDADAGVRGYLLGLDPTAGDGRLIVALGDPDQADHVLTYVPGMTSDLSSVTGELSRTERMLEQCARLGPTETTAAVLWLDYDAPDFLDEAMREAPARDAGPGLHRFQEGLRAGHGDDPAHLTVLGHSYGSLVVGTTAREHGLAADDLVFLGSPGVGVDHAEQLRQPGTQVWASTAGNDIIRQVGAPSELLARVGLSVALPGVGAVLAFRSPPDDLWFGRDPSDPDFGARTFPSARRGHLGYWDADNPALDGVARITLDR